MPEAGRLRGELRRLAGYAPDAPAVGAVVSERRSGDGHVIEEIRLDGHAPVPATLIHPGRPGRLPAVLYAHAHCGDHALGRRELLDGSRFFAAPGYGPALANLGFAAMCIDMPGFGERRHEGTETALAKAALWRGECLFGQMLGDLGAALGYLAARADVDAGRIFTLGLSMGAAHAMWLAALDERVAGCAQIAMLADIGPLIAAGAHDRHGPYLTVPGLLRAAEMGDVAGLVAPRPQLVCHGGRDELTPPPARDAALARLATAYARHEGALVETMIDPEAGHGESAPMRVAVLDFLPRALRRASPFAAE